MDVFGEWSPLVKALASLAGLAFFVHRAVILWKERKRRRMLARRRPRPPSNPTA